MLLNNLIHHKKKQIIEIASEYGVKSIKIFGSVARGEEDQNSDIDFLVDFEDGRTLFDLIALKNELEKLLNKSVDIVTEESIHHTIRENIIREVAEI